MRPAASSGIKNINGLRLSRFFLLVALLLLISVKGWGQPTAFTVTGTGSYCQGTGGLPVGLDNSEIGVTYTLVRDGNPQVPTVGGTGGAISFGDQLSGSYTVSGTNGGGTTGMNGQAVISENATPAAPTVSVVDNCGTSTLTASGYTGTLLWSTSATTASITVNTAGIYTVTQTVTGCTSSAGSGIAAPKTTPATPTVSVVDNCNGTSTLTASGYTGSLLWSTSATTASITVNTAGTYTVTQTISGCTSSLGSGIAAPKTTPSAPSVGLITQPTCSTTTGSVILNGLPAGNWTINPGAIAGTGVNTTVSNLVAGTYNFTVTNAAGCISSASINVVINAQPLTPVVPNQFASILSGGTFTVTPSGGTIPVGTTYTWTAPVYTGSVTGGSAQISPQLNISGTLTVPSGVGTATYTVTPVFGTCTGATFTVTVTVTSTCVPVTLG